jgi:galactokinase/mevalonate kinase-like predicted kinase
MFLHDSWSVRRPLDTTQPRGLTTVRVPARFDFIGGWTDTPPYYFDHEAAVLNTTVRLKRIGSQIDAANDKVITVSIQAADEWTVYENGQPLIANQDHIVINAVKDVLGLVLPPVRLTIDNNIPKGSGLGGSSLLASAIYAAFVSYYEGVDLSAPEVRRLIDGILVVEQMMTSGGGWQDQIGGVLGGLKLISTTPGKLGYKIQRCSPEVVEKLNRCSLVVNSNRQRRAAMILWSIREKCYLQDPKAMKLMEEIRSNAVQGFDQLQANKIGDFAQLYATTWQHVNDVETKTSIPLVEELTTICGDTLLGCKIGGAGGGGFVVMTFADEAARNAAATKIAMELPGSDIYEPIFGGSGLEIEQGSTHEIIPDHTEL